MSKQSEVEVRLYELNCANAAWHEAAGANIAEAQQRFLDALRWFRDNDIAVATQVDATFRGVYVLVEGEKQG